MFRLLLVTYAYPPSIGGVERHSQRLAHALIERGHRVHVITAKIGDAPERECDPHGVEITRVSAGSGSRWRKMTTYLTAMTRAAVHRRSETDVIHVQQALYPAAAMAVAARAMGKPLVVRNSGSGQHGAVQLMSRLPLGATGLGMIRRFATMVSLSAEMTAEMTVAGFRNVVTIPNGVAVSSLGDRSAARRALGLDDSSHVVLYAGRLDREKGTALLARTWPLVRTPNAVLLVAGDGPERALLPASVRVDGYVSDVALYFAAADMFVLPSESEGISNALLEAMAAGLPVVATDVGGNRAVIATPSVGALVAPGDPAALAHAIDAVLVDRELRDRLGEAARAHVTARWSFDAMVDAYEQLYERVIAGR